MALILACALHIGALARLIAATERPAIPALVPAARGEQRRGGAGERPLRLQPPEMARTESGRAAETYEDARSPEAERGEAERIEAERIDPSLTKALERRWSLRSSAWPRLFDPVEP